MDTIAYKIVEDSPRGACTLFHGLDGSRVIPVGKWLKAEKKMVRDGTSHTYYESGWHVLLTEEDAKDYMKAFKRRLEKLRIVPVLVRNLRKKEHSRSPVYLADEMCYAG